MTPVIRIDDKVMAVLEEKAVEYKLVFKTPNSTLRIILGLDPRPSASRQAATSHIQAKAEEVEDEFVVEGEVYCQNPKAASHTWEIGHFKRPGRDLLSFDTYPFVEHVGTPVTLVVGGKEYPASYHHRNRGGYIGRRSAGSDAPRIKDILEAHGLCRHKKEVVVRFCGESVFLQPR